MTVVAKGEALGNAIAARREELEMTQQAVADAMEGEFGRSVSTIGQIERAEIDVPPPGVRRELERALEMESGALDAYIDDEMLAAEVEAGAEGAISKSEPEADDRSAGEDVMSTIKRFTGHVEPLVKQLPEAVEKGPSTFRTELGKELLWNGTSALRSAISEAIDSDGIDTMEGVKAAIDDFAKWLLNLLGFDQAEDVVMASEPAADATTSALT